MSYTGPLPVSPHDPAFRAALQRDQLDYIAAERWRYTRAMALPPCQLDRVPPEVEFAKWDALGLHVMTPAELQARLDQLDEMERQALHDGPWLDRGAHFAALRRNYVDGAA